MKTYKGNKLRSQKSEISQWKNDKTKIDEESLQLYGLVKKATENLWIKLVTLIKMWEIFKHKYVNPGTLFTIFNYPFGSPKANFGPLHWQEVNLAYLMLIITWCWSIRALKTSKRGYFPMSSLACPAYQSVSKQEASDLGLKC